MSTLLEFLGFGGRERDGEEGYKPTDGYRGFTLVELLVVIAIISVLATLLLLQLGVARAKARDAKRIADVNQVRSANELYFDDNGSYLNTNVMTVFAPKYLVSVPKDPLAPGCTDTYGGTGTGPAFCYGYSWTNTANAPAAMMIWAELEQSNKNALSNDTDIDSSGWTSGAPQNGKGSAGFEACTSTTTKDCIYDSGQP